MISILSPVRTERCVLWFLSALIMARGGIVMQIVLCIIERKDCQSTTQPKTVIKHIDTYYEHTHSREFRHFMLVNKAEVCQSVQRDRFRSNHGPLMALTEPRGLPLSSQLITQSALNQTQKDLIQSEFRNGIMCYKRYETVTQFRFKKY